MILLLICISRYRFCTTIEEDQEQEDEEEKEEEEEKVKKVGRKGMADDACKALPSETKGETWRRST